MWRTTTEVTDCRYACEDVSIVHGNLAECYGKVNVASSKATIGEYGAAAVRYGLHNVGIDTNLVVTREDFILLRKEVGIGAGMYSR